MDLFSNHTLVVAIVSWALAQALKVVYLLLTQRKLELWRMASSGGMPSSHSALVTGLATAVGLSEGVQSTVFAITVVLAGVVMYDAAGIRQAVSIQARILNRLIDELVTHQSWNEKRLRELLGHTRVEVFAGFLLGLIVAFVWLR